MREREEGGERDRERERVYTAIRLFIKGHNLILYGTR